MRIFEVSRGNYVPRIRIINLVDILFILLLFFIATTTFRFAAKEPTAVKLQLPEAKTAEEVGKSKSNQLRVTVTPDGAIYLDKNRIAVSGLEKALREAKQKNPDLVLELSADKSTSYGTVVSVVDAARAADIRNITAFTKKLGQ
jgi:biopolymer transport protein ExbD